MLMTSPVLFSFDDTGARVWLVTLESSLHEKRTFPKVTVEQQVCI